MTQPSSSSEEHERTLRVAIVAWQAITAVFPVEGRNVGGLETAAWLLARELAACEDVECSFVVRANQQVDMPSVDSVDFVIDVDPRESARRHVSKALEDGFANALRSFGPKLIGQVVYLAVTWPIRRRDPVPCEVDPRLRSLSPDVWIAMGVSRESAGVIATANDQERPSVLMIQSNADLDSRYATDPSFRSRYGEASRDCLFAIQHATQVVCQTNDQLRLLKETFGRDGMLIRNAIDLNRWPQTNAGSGSYVLWIGRYDDFHKRPHLAMQIAAGCPEIPFRMIINPSDDGVRDRLMRSLLSNVTIDEYVPADQMPSTMAGCRVFLSTGSADYEGFPNVLLQATASGKPIVSLDDFDNYLENSRAGIHCAGDIEAATTAVRELWSGTRIHDAGKTRQYLRENYSVGAVIAKVKQLLVRLKRGAQ